MRAAVTGFETFLMRRSATMRFAPGMYVFPGGRVDNDDVSNVDELTSYINCAVREVFEETGVVLEQQPGDLVFADHWVTPEFVPVRYSARFFSGQDAARANGNLNKYRDRSGYLDFPG